MIYSSVAIDVFNLICRVRGRSKKPSSISRSFITCVDTQVTTHLREDGKLYLVFDPTPKDDLGVSKSFTRTTTRQAILSDYKQNRVRDPLITEVASFLMKYYAYRGPNIVSVYSDEFEADDFIEPLVPLVEKPLALLSTDIDWARYLSDEPRVDLINDAWDRPYTVNEFETIFGFEPTTAAITTYKALFGDTSDNIQGAINVKRAKFSTPIKMLCKNFITQVAHDRLTTQQVIDMFTKTSFATVMSHETKTPFDELYLTISMVDEKAPVTDTLVRNLAVIRSQLEGKDISKFMHTLDERPRVNALLHGATFGLSFKDTFGRV